MRFTKIPLIATLMAVALSLLIVLPTLAQENQKTDGQLNNVDITAGVFANIADAELAKNVDGLQDDEDGNDIFVPAPTPPPTPANGSGSQEVSEAAWLLAPASSAQDTFFNNTLYVSNEVSAFNTVLINVANEATTNCEADNAATTDVDESTFGIPNVTATVKNNRSNQSIKVQLVVSTDAGNFQGYFKVVEQGATGSLPGPDTTLGTDDDITGVAYGTNTSDDYAGPTWCADQRRTGSFHTDDDSDPNTPSDNDDGDPNTTDTPTSFQLETTATSAVYGPVQHSENAAPEAAQEIATIFAKHGDRLTISSDDGSGQVQLLVDGEGPDISSVTPDDNAVLESRRLTFSFEVRDDDSGLRHDAEPVTSIDGDLRHINPDGDADLGTEPLSEDPGTAVDSNGASRDIDVDVATNSRNGPVADPDPDAYSDISASGTWRMAANRAGVAYAFTASGADRDDGYYLYRVKARDRAGNESVTDADDRASGDQPHVFRVDDTDPDLMQARTGISYDTDDDRETVDRSYIALDFGMDALGDVNTDNITVVGHNIVGMIHPTTAPRINRDEAMATTPPSGPAPRNPGNPPSPVLTDPATRTPAVATPTGWDNTFLSGTDRSPADPNPNEENATYGTCTDADTTNDDTECPQWRVWIAYESYVSDKRTYDHEKMVYDNYNLYKEENPGTNIEGDYITEPRSSVYIELSEELASDATPTVLVVGGAVFDLAGNTNAAKTLSKAQDWIAPRLIVTVTGTANDRPVANDDGSFTIDVTSDEDVARRPAVFFVTATGALNDDEDGYDYTIDAFDSASSLTQQEDDNHWAKKYRTTTIGDGAFEGLVGVVVLVRDEAGNSGAAAGWEPMDHQNAANPAAGDDLDLGDMDDAGLLIEIDDNIDDAANKFVTPRSDEQGSTGGKVTESANPFVKLEFTDEGKEYDACPPVVTEGDDAPGGCKSGVSALRDSHGGVNITEITLNGDDVLTSLARVDKNQFSLVMRDLADGSYTVAYTAEDDAGNEVEGEFKFSKEPREPYEIAVTPGWNLISLPATPLEPAIGAVLAGNPYISPVLGYQEGDWVTAIQEEDGTWRGRLTELEGGYGYWVHARTFETIETMLAETDPASTLPTVPVTQGWNLLGVLDVYQNDAGDAPGAPGDNGDEANNYLGSIPWRVAYTYATDRSLWIKTVPDATAMEPDPEGGEGAMREVTEIVNGKGYWVWSSSPSTLAP